MQSHGQTRTIKQRRAEQECGFESADGTERFEKCANCLPNRLCVGGTERVVLDGPIAQTFQFGVHPIR